MTNSNVKLFADDTSLFSVVHDVNASARELNDDLKKINKWAFQWKMSFNPGPSKQAQEVIFSRKIRKHPSLVFDNNNVLQTSSQKHLGVIFDVKLTFDEHINNVLNKVNANFYANFKICYLGQHYLPYTKLLLDHTWI